MRGPALLACVIGAACLASCSLALDPEHYQLCDPIHPPTCDGDDLVVCEGDLAVVTHCADGCNPDNAACIAPRCGNGVVDEGEVCDDRNADSGDGCRGDCAQVEGCGNGVLDQNELCEDGNMTDGDGCDCQAFDLLVNTTHEDKQTSPVAAFTAAGEGFIVWEDASGTSPDSSPAVRGRVAQGSQGSIALTGSDFVLNTTVNLEQAKVDVGASILGTGFMVVWRDGSMSFPDTDHTSIRARMFTEAGSPVADKQDDFVVNTTLADKQDHPAVAALPDGGYLVVWEDDSQTPPDDSEAAIRMQRFDANGDPVDDEQVVNQTIVQKQSYPAVAVAGDTILIVWEDESSSDPEIRGRRYDASTSPLQPIADDAASDFHVNTKMEGGQEKPEVTATAGGAFVVVWEDSDPTDEGDIRARVIPASGAISEQEFVVNPTTTGQQTSMSVAAVPTGVLVAWEDYSMVDPDTSGAIRIRWLSKDGERLDNEDQVLNTLTLDNQQDPDIAVIDDNHLLVVWEDESLTPPDTDADAIRARLVDAPP